MISLRKLAAGVATTVLAAALAEAAHAQSTATQQQEVIVTGSRAPRTIGGAITQVQQAGDISIVTQELFQREVPSANVAQLINLLPGVNYESEDAYGLTSGTIRIHGLEGNRLSFTIDGAPVNDTGNYAVYPGEYLVSELTDRVQTNLGGSDVDSPSPSALGGTVNIISKLPDVTPSATVRVSAGDYSYYRTYGEFDTGAIGPTGLRSYVAFNYASYDKWRGSGAYSRIGGDFRLYQPLRGTDFISLAGTWVSERGNTYYSGSRANFAQYGMRDYDYNTVWATPTVRPGVADTVPTPAFPSNGGGNDTYFYQLRQNPVDFATLRGTSKFTLFDKLTLTIDPSFFYTLANGGGSTAVSETDLRLKGRTNTGVDLNGDGDTLDTVALYTPSNTNTRRWVVLSSLLYALDEHNNFQLAYTFDHGDHRQTGEATAVYGGTPTDPFGGKDGYGATVATADGSFLRTRDRHSIALLNQVAANYLGRFFDDRLHLNVGVRAPFFERDLNQFCYTYNGTSAYCTTADPAAVQAAYDAGVANKNTTALAAYIPGVTFNTGSAAPNLRFPFTQTIHYSDVLPNAGATFRLAQAHLFYIDYNKGFAAPRTDNLYSSVPNSVQPETTDTVSGGYRFQTSAITASISGYDTEYHNRVLTIIDRDDPTLSIDRNVGGVSIYGMDAEIGFRPFTGLSLNATATLQKSEQHFTETVSISGVTSDLPTKGKEFVDTPDRMFTGRAQYVVGPLTVGIQGKYTSSRWEDEVNSERLPGFATFDADVRYTLPFFGGNSFVQVNATNLFDRTYVARFTSVNAAKPTVTSSGQTYAAGTPFFYIAQPRTVLVTLQTKF